MSERNYAIGELIRELIYIFVFHGHAQRSHFSESQRRILHLYLRLKHIHDEVESVSRTEHFILWHKFVFFDQFEIENVIDETEEKIDLRDDNSDQMHGLSSDVLVQQALQYH